MNDMQDKQKDGNEQKRTEASANRSQSANGQAPGLHSDQELAFRLKASIDERGKYIHSLADMAAGLAAGSRLPHSTAKQLIQDRFEVQMGQTPQEYLDQQYALRKEHGLTRGNGRGR